MSKKDEQKKGDKKPTEDSASAEPEEGKIPAETSEDARQASNLQKHIEELTDDLKRVQADFVNYRKRSEKERIKAVRVGKRKAIESLLPLIDNIERALQHVPKKLQDNPWARGVHQVGKQVDQTLQEMGVEKIEAEDRQFDPNLHEAVSFEDGEGDEVIEEVMQTGFKLEDEVIRPAMVKVTRKPRNERSQETQNEQE